jgi:hypothetical protein
MSRQVHRGFIATILAITLVGLTAAAFAAIAVMTRTDMRRTNGEHVGAQLRQLLLIGAADAAARSDSMTPSNSSIALPNELVSDGGSVTVEIAADPIGSGATARIVATFRGNTAEQSVKFSRVGERWRTSGVELESAAQRRGG